jgi:hypothetical protein
MKARLTWWEWHSTQAQPCESARGNSVSARKEKKDGDGGERIKRASRSTSSKSAVAALGITNRGGSTNVSKTSPRKKERG